MIIDFGVESNKTLKTDDIKEIAKTYNDHLTKTGNVLDGVDGGTLNKTRSIVQTSTGETG